MLAPYPDSGLAQVSDQLAPDGSRPRLARYLDTRIAPTYVCLALGLSTPWFDPIPSKSRVTLSYVTL